MDALYKKHPPAITFCGICSYVWIEKLTQVFHCYASYAGTSLSSRGSVP